MTAVETRGGAELEVREANGHKTVTGYASVFNVRYPVTFYDEVVLPGSFRRTLANSPDVVFLVNHEGEPLGRTTAGNLRLEERQRGLFMECELDPLDSHAQSVARKIETGLLPQMSFSFRSVEETWDSAKTLRQHKVLEIHKGDVSAVNFGASETTSIGVRAHEVPLEERERRAAMIGKAVRGYVPASALRAETCARCGGTGNIELRCPNCGGTEGNAESDGTAPWSVPSATDGRSALSEFPSMDVYWKRSGLGSPAERAIRRGIRDEAKRRENAELEHRAEMIADWRRELDRAAAARRKREQLYRGLR